MKTPTDQPKGSLNMRKQHEKELRTIRRVIKAGEASIAAAEKKSIKVRNTVRRQADRVILAETRACAKYTKGLRKDNAALARRAAILEGRLS